MTIIIIGSLVGLSAGLISTLLGGGAGLIAVPAFYYIIIHNFGADFAMQISLATCGGMSLFLSLVAVYKHIRNGNIVFNKTTITYIVVFMIGAVIGTLLIKTLDTSIIKKTFSILLFLSGFWMLLHKEGNILKLPKIIESIALSICGIFSVLLTSSTFATIFFVKVGMNIKKAISLTSFCVLINSISLSFLLVYGINIDVPKTYGYMSIPLLVSSAPFAIVGSLIAVKFLTILSHQILHRLFIALMFISAIIMCF